MSRNIDSSTLQEEDMTMKETEVLYDMIDNAMRRNMFFVILSIGLGLFFFTGIIIFSIINVDEVLSAYYIFTNALYGVLSIIYGTILLQTVRAIKKLGVSG